MYTVLVNSDEESLDQEWVELILSAKQLGLTQNEIRDFLRNSMDKEAI